MKRTIDSLPTKAALLAALYLSAIPAHAQGMNFTWSPNTAVPPGPVPNTFDYLNAANWMPAGVRAPGGTSNDTDTATFGPTTVPNGSHISMNFGVGLAAWNFTSPGYIITTSRFGPIVFFGRVAGPGTGIHGSPTIEDTAIDFGTSGVENGTTAGNATINIDNFNQLLFFANSTAGQAKINTNGDIRIAVNGAFFGRPPDSASAGNATINTSAHVRFFNDGTAGNSTINIVNPPR